jgi:hypothetical protein
MAQAAVCFFRGTAAMVSRRRIHGWFLKTYRDYAESPSGDSALNALSAFMGRTASLFFKLNRLETTSRHRSQKGIESDINRNCQQNAKKEFPGNEPAEKNGRRVEKKKHKKCLSRTKRNGNSKKDSPVQSSQSLNWGVESCLRRKEILSGSKGEGNQGF